MRFAAVVLVAAGAIAALPGAALAGHANLDEGRPVRFEDPYPIPRGEWSFELGGGYLDPRPGKDHAFFPIEVLYGAILNTQLSAGTVLFMGDSTASVGSGDVRLSALYNFGQESSVLPGLGLKYTLILPTGTDSHGVDAQIKALITKSISRVSFHANFSELLVGERSFGERSSRFEIDLGTSFPLGTMHTRTLLLLGWFSERAPESVLENRTGVELGIRRQQTTRTVLDLGIGTESRGRYEGSRVRVSAGLSWSY